MTRTLTKLERTEYVGAVKVRKYEVDITSYTTGGEALTPGDVRLNRFIDYSITNPAADGVYAQYDEANEKLVVYAAGGSELSAAGSATINFTAYGK